ncbi:hypothetical protein ACLOJK_040744 [Asimina triloba]
MCQAQNKGCDLVIVRSCVEFEGDYLNLIKDLYQKPIIPIGLLPPLTSYPSKGRDSPTWSTTFDRLNKKEANSTVFVGFGSEYRITREIKSMNWHMDWSYPSCHSCGSSGSQHGHQWTARISFQVGLKPARLIRWLNARLLVDKGVGHEVERNDDGSFTRIAVAQATRDAMVGQDCEPLRQRARQMTSIFSDASLHRGYIDRFLQYLDDLKGVGHT